MPPDWIELVVSGLISLTLVGLGGYYLLREHVERRRQNGYRNLPPVDARHFRFQYIRRAVGSSLLILSGVAIFIGQTVMDWRAEPKIYAWLWIGVMLGLLGIISLAGADLWSIYRYSRRHQRRIAEDRQAMIRRQLEEYRAERRDGPSTPPGWSPDQN